MQKHWTIVCALVICAPGAWSQQGAQNAKRGLTYQSLASLPDWSGAFSNYRYLDGATARNPALETETPPLKDPAALAKFKDAQKLLTVRGDNQARQAAAGARGGRGAGAGAGAGGGNGIGVGVGGVGRGGFSGTQTLGPTGFMEILFSPGRVTLITDGGNVRRIYTDGTVADPSFITAMGTSIGHWEGDTLVVDTVGLNPKTTLLGVAQAGEGFKVHERIFMKQKDVLEFDTTVEAPNVFSTPYHMLPQLFQHEYYRPEMLQPYVGEVAARDRSVDPVTHSQTFDLTPPSDLPPPPPRKN